MSYIRADSNPERLYIYEVDETIYFWVGADYQYCMPADVFKALMRTYVKCDDLDEIKYEGATLRRLLHGLEGQAARSDFGKWELSYGEWSIRLWPVTLEYIARRFRDDEWREAIVPGQEDSEVGRLCSTPEGAAKFLAEEYAKTREENKRLKRQLGRLWANTGTKNE